MSLWRLIVEDYGKIKRAEIDVAPLTMFVGDNNSGKSYLMALLWGIQELGITALIGDEYVDTEDINSVVEWIYQQISIAITNKKHEVLLGEISELLETVLNNELQKNKEKFVRNIFNSNAIDIGKLEIKLENMTDKKLSFECIDGSGMVDISYGNTGGIGISKKILEEKWDGAYDLKWLLIRIIYSVCLGAELFETERAHNIYLPAARTGFMLTKDIINKVGRKNTFNFYKEKEEIGPFTRPINHFLDVMGDLSLDAMGKEANLKLVSQLESEMTDGTIEISNMPNKEVQYVPNGYDKGFPLRLSSAVVTELAPLILILKHKKDITSFYYEEPEMCLHPQLQNKVGKTICRMVNSDIQMLITTHSDILIQHINNMIKLSKHRECKEICGRFGYIQSDLLSAKQVKVYQLKAKTNEKTIVEELKCGENGFVVSTFNDALDDIMDEAYEIQG